MQENHLEATHRIANEYDGHLVLCDERKAALWRNWQHTRPAPEVVDCHNGLIGLIPWSIKTTVVDVDGGDPRQLPLPIVSIPTPRDGAHLYFEDVQRRGNGKIRLEGYRWRYTGRQGLCSPLGRQSSCIRGLDAYAWDLSRAAQLSLFTRRELSPGPAPEVANQVSADLSTVMVGSRNTSLFDAVRLWAYRQRQDGSYKQYHYQVTTFALISNQTIPHPLPESEVLSVAYSVSSWTWSRMRPKRVRATNGKAAGIASGLARRKATAARDLEIVAGRHLEGEKPARTGDGLST